MTKSQHTIFTCDFCGKESEPIAGGIPYHKGWVYLYKMNGKVERDKIRESADKHLCGKQCVINFVDKFFDKKTKVANEKNDKQKEDE
jgi:hypothetical protein